MSLLRLVFSTLEGWGFINGLKGVKNEFYHFINGKRMISLIEG